MHKVITWTRQGLSDALWLFVHGLTDCQEKNAPKSDTNSRNGYFPKRLMCKYGDIELSVFAQI